MMEAECPILNPVKETVSAGRSFAKHLRRLRRKSRNCNVCIEKANCLIMEEFNAVVDRVILEVNEEWGKGS
jgi:hypothetical protein